MTLKFILAFTLFLWGLSSHVQPSPANVVVIDAAKSEPYTSVRHAMLAEVKRRSSVSNLDIKTKHYSLDHYKGAASNIWHYKINAQKPPKVIVLNGTLAVDAFKDIILAHPAQAFIFSAVTDPVGLGIIHDFSLPLKANITGISYPVPVADRFSVLLKFIPKLKNVGLIYADMPQSQSYKQWILDYTRTHPIWKDINIHYREVEFIPSNGGPVRMTKLAEKYILELDPIVDVFISPNHCCPVKHN